jgi:hypothetical protein
LKQKKWRLDEESNFNVKNYFLTANLQGKKILKIIQKRRQKYDKRGKTKEEACEAIVSQ